jgi:hypothetical protein
MTNADTNLVQKIVETPPVLRIRRNHGLEHATLNILSQRFPHLHLAGHSDFKGFWIVGDVPIEAVRDAAEEALSRMRAGESRLAVHHNCGTNYVTSGMLAGVAGVIAMIGVGRRWRDKLERLPLAMSLATLALIVGMPLGTLVQARVTTSGDPGDMHIVEIMTKLRGPADGGLKAHRVITRG